jgi:hypothetical protein
LNAVQFGLLFVFSAGKPDELIQTYSRRIPGVALVDLYQKPEYQGCSAGKLEGKWEQQNSCSVISM